MLIKKSTLIVAVCAIALVGGVYFFQARSDKAEKPSEDTSKPAFAIKADNITALTISHLDKKGEPAIQLSELNGNWDIVQPIATGADQSAVRGIVDGLADARVSQTEPGTPDRLQAYGLNSPRAELDFELKNGTKHKILMGDKDFTEVSVYSLIDGAKTVSLLPISLYNSADKPVDDLRDRSVLHIDSGKIASFELKNASGELTASKQTVKGQTQWNFTQPIGVRADDDNVSSLLSAVANGKFTKVAEEKSENPSKYGLSNAAVTFTAVDDSGQKHTLLVGKKQGDGYLARDESGPAIFVINEDLYKKLTENLGELRDKNLVHITENDVNHIELKDANGTTAMTRKPGSEFDWTIESPANVKGKSAASWKVFSPLTSARAEDVIDHASGAVLAKLAKPAIEVNLTEKSGAKLTIKISGADGDFVFGRTSAGPSVYKLKKSILDDLNLKPSDLAS
jgi:Domain of unknown function (DUF4340)